MSAHRFYLKAALKPGPPGPVRAALASEDIHHLRDVLRVGAGEEIELVEPEGGQVWRAKVEAVDRGGLSVELLEAIAPRAEPQVVLVQGVAKGDKMDTIVRQAVEVGVAGVLPVLTKRTVVRLDAPKCSDRGERWRRIAKAAAEQSHRSMVPIVADPRPWSDVLAAIREFEVVLVLWEEGSGADLVAQLRSEDLTPESRVALVVGPEGGLAAEEVAVLEQSGARVVTLGANILRTETAAIVGLALTLHALGGLGTPRV